MRSAGARRGGEGFDALPRRPRAVVLGSLGCISGMANCYFLPANEVCHAKRLKTAAKRRRDLGGSARPNWGRSE